MNGLALSFGAALAGWFVMFSPWTRGALPFWPAMSAASGLLACLGLWESRGELGRLFRFRWSWLAAGLVSAGGLYLVFAAGDAVAGRLFAFAPGQVRRIYALGAGAPAPLVAALLALWIAPAEEIFWRGFLQRRLMLRLGRWRGYALGVLLYSVVHVFALNLMLLGAAALCGVLWGWLLLRFRSLWPGIVSHAVWDVLIFVLIPIR